MEQLSSVPELRAYRARCREKGQSVAFVPTMGYLHSGHLALVEAARRRADVVVVSIYVNPTQFGVGEDLDRYPRDLARDRRLLEELGVDLLWTPSNADMYPDGASTFVSVEGTLSSQLCGASRPTHFRGVTTVVAKLLQVLRPDVAVFGLKDFQQFQVVGRMVRDLFLDVEILGVPTVREADGLAMSSRNAFLSPEERAAAPAIRRGLLAAAREVRAGRAPDLVLEGLAREIESAGGRVDYIDVLDAGTLERYDDVAMQGGLTGEDLPALIALAAWFGAARLIDNIVVSLDATPPAQTSSAGGSRPDGESD